ncbi:accessory gene regulator protein AgrB [Staphylococcus saprophyticus]
MVKFIDAKIDNFAKQLQQRNNLDRIEYLKMRLGMQVVVNNFFKTIVIYGVSLLCHMFLYTLTVHLTFFLLDTLRMAHTLRILYFVIYKV